MGMARLIRRAAPLIVVGLAGAAAARRRAQRTRVAQLPPGPYPPPVARAEPVVEPEAELPADEQPTVEQTALTPWLDQAGEHEDDPAPEEPEFAEVAGVTEIVDDLLAPGEDGERIEDATVVEGSAEEDEPPESAL